VTAILDDSFLKPYKKKPVNWGFNGLGYVVFKRTYARVCEDGATEEWWETIARCIRGAQDLGAGYEKKEAERLFDHIFNLRCSFAGRMLWQLGTDTVKRIGAASLLNCWFVAIREPKDFCFLFDQLMLGGGVGFSVRREDVHELPKVKENVSVTHYKRNDTDFIVPDSREGWVSLLAKVLDSYFITGRSFTYSTVLIRSRGEPIRGFGGTASGPAILVEGVDKICRVLRLREGKKMRSVDALDIANIIGSIVVAGNVRRSAEIALGDPDDILFLRAKRWDLGSIPVWRAMSNNSIYADAYDHIMEHVWNGYQGNGEPYGFFNLPLARRMGRLGDEVKDNCEGLNPCGEIALSSYECCNLSEIFLNNIESQEQLEDCAKLLYKAQKAIAASHYHYEETNKIVHKNMRLGIGVTGVCQSLSKNAWLSKTYRALRSFDKAYSKEKGWPQSIKLTTVKPSGTLSLLAGSSPGVHPFTFPFFIRRVRIASDDALVGQLREAGYELEYLHNQDGTKDHATTVVSFPCRAGDGARVAADLTAVAQLDLVAKLQTDWADNAVSVTIYYKKEELEAIKEWMRKNYSSSIKSVSFLLHRDHNFVQAPYEEITEERYKEMLKAVKPLKDVSAGGVVADECDGGACPVR
jgi:ribonucleoside-triphosphate reductase (thioredoxin)